MASHVGSCINVYSDDIWRWHSVYDFRLNSQDVVKYVITEDINKKTKAVLLFYGQYSINGVKKKNKLLSLEYQVHCRHTFLELLLV